jgi:CRISPR-associated endonuclease/helicase Cas3
MNEIDFADTFEALTGNAPFPWQEALYECFTVGPIPSSCNLPTGLGKTSVIPIWLIALANHPEKVPRRLVYVVNRRTVVDQATMRPGRSGIG